MKIIGERLRGLRESVRLSQAKLAKEFDVSQSALARYEIDDSTPSPEVFLKYADYFDVSLDYIFGRTDDPHGMIYNNCVKLGPVSYTHLDVYKRQLLICLLRHSDEHIGEPCQRPGGQLAAVV